MTTDPLYAYISDKGPIGQYRILHNGKGAGTLKPMELVVYQDIITEMVFVREFSNFQKQMALIPVDCVY